MWWELQKLKKYITTITKDSLKKKLTILCLLLCTSLFAQEQFKEDLKVGLVLSGGGAKGLAHIGVLKTIDSLGVKVDYIAGTSMGAIIGSLYASGYSGQQLDSIFRQVDFDALISDYLPRDAKTTYVRENAERYALTLPFDDFKIQLPTALSKGQNIYNLLAKLTTHVSTVSKFEQLPIPFFCIATDVETGEPVVLSEGSLPQAVTASGALPSLFQPVTIGNQILIDGGVTNNYPIHELKAKGMDVIIGVDVQDGLVDRTQLKSAPEILIQISNYRTINDMKDKVDETDIYIKPDITDFNVVSFNDGHQIVENGVVAANSQAKALKELASKQGFFESHSLNVKPLDSLMINQVVIKGINNYTISYVLGKLKFKTKERISYEEFQNGINNLVATNNFDSFIYDLEPDGEGFLMHTQLTETENTTFIRLGLHYDDLYKSAALINFTKKRTLFKNDVFSLDLGIGDNVRYNLEYYIDKGFYWSVGVQSRYNGFNTNINADLLLDQNERAETGLNKIDTKLSDFTSQFFVQTLFRNDLSLTLGAEYKHLSVTSETLIDTTNTTEDKTVFEKDDFFAVFGKLTFDSYDNKYFPSKGLYLAGDFHWYFTASNKNSTISSFSIAKAKLGYAFKIGSKLAVNIGSEGGFKIGEDVNRSLNFALGGYGNNLINNFIPFYGYDFISLAGDGFVKGNVGLDYEFIKNHHFNIAANYANIENGLFDGVDWFTAPDYSGYAFGYGLETLIGPIEAKYTYSPETHESTWFFNVGFWF